MTALIVYVDDIMVKGNDEVEVSHLKSNSAREFEIKDLGSLKYFLVVKVARSRQRIFLYQRKYVLDLLKDSDMMGCKPCVTPIEVNHRLKGGDNERLIDVSRYQRLVGRFIYLSLTRLDIAYIVGVISLFMHTPTQVHMEASYRVLKYLKGCLGKGIMYNKFDH